MKIIVKENKECPRRVFCKDCSKFKNAILEVKLLEGTGWYGKLRVETFLPVYSSKIVFLLDYCCKKYSTTMETE